MEKSESIKELAGALGCFQDECPEIELNSTVEVETKSGGKYKFKYATLNHVLKVITPILKKNGLSYCQLPENDNSITTMLMHISGEWIAGNKPLDLPNGCTAQSVGSYITYYKRYSILAMLGVVAEDDEDGNIASGNTAKKSDKPWLNPGSQAWKEAIKYLQGEGTVDKIKTKYAISKVNIEKLKAEVL